MTHNGFPHGDPVPSKAVGAAGASARIPEIVRHMTLALSRHVRRLAEAAN
jgi:hypothetical protein